MHNLKLISAFAFHTVAAVLLFALIGGAAALLNMYTRLLERAGMSEIILQAIHFTEYFLFAVDLFCFVVFILREVWLLLREMLMLPQHHGSEMPPLLAGPDNTVHPEDL